MYEANCEWCREDFSVGWNGKRWGARFCSDKCRIAYNNARKKLDKLRFTMHDNLDYFRAMMFKGGELPQVAAEAIFIIAKDANVHQMKFGCKACGQQRMDFPRTFDKCSFCGKTDWKFEIRGDE
jgi:hypothetical protein